MKTAKLRPLCSLANQKHQINLVAVNLSQVIATKLNRLRILMLPHYRSGDFQDESQG